MSDLHADRVIDKYIGQPAMMTQAKSDVQHVIEFRRLNDKGWYKLITKVGADRVHHYREEMERKAQELGL